MVLKENIVNYTGPFPFVWDEIVVPVRYGSEQHTARKILLALAEQVVGQYKAKAEESWQNVKQRYMVETPSFDSVVSLVANDNWLEFTVRYLVPYNKRRSVKDMLFLKIVDAFEETGGKVRFASMTVEITDFPRLGVDVG